MIEDFYIEKRIYYHDTDAGGVVYYGAYFRHLEEARCEYCRSRGIDLAAYAKKGVQFPVVHVEVEYKAPAGYGDKIRVFTRLETIGNSSLHFLQKIKREELVLVKAKTVWACIGSDFKSRDVPQEIRRALG